MVAGLVIDSSSRKPLAGAVLYVDRVRVAKRAGKDGKFQVKLASKDTVLIVSRGDHVPVRIRIEPSTADVGTVSLLAVSTDEHRAAVVAEVLRVHPQLADFYRRRKDAPRGFFYTLDDLDKIGARDVVEALWQNRELLKLCFRGRQGTLICGRDPNPVRGLGNMEVGGARPCEVDVWVDGAHMNLGSVFGIALSDVIAIEAYAESVTTPRDFGATLCGAVGVWTTGAGK